MASTTGRCSIRARNAAAILAALLAMLTAGLLTGCTDQSEAFDDGQPGELAATNERNRGQGPDHSDPIPDDEMPEVELPEPAQAVAKARTELAKGRQENQGANNDKADDDKTNNNKSDETPDNGDTPDNNGNNGETPDNNGNSNTAPAADETATKPSENELLSTLEPLDADPDGKQQGSLRDGRSRNEAGELRQLDESAALACGDVETAITAFDEGDTEGVKKRLKRASKRADASGMGAMQAWSVTLADSADSTDVAVLVAFLSACTEGGYEL